MYKITINIENIANASDACKIVANLIDKGYVGGLLGVSADSWDISAIIK